MQNHLDRIAPRHNSTECDEKSCDKRPIMAVLKDIETGYLRRKSKQTEAHSAETQSVRRGKATEAVSSEKTSADQQKGTESSQFWDSDVSR